MSYKRVTCGQESINLALRRWQITTFGRTLLHCVGTWSKVLGSSQNRFWLRLGFDRKTVNMIISLKKCIEQLPKFTNQKTPGFTLIALPPPPLNITFQASSHRLFTQRCSTTMKPLWWWRWWHAKGPIICLTPRALDQTQNSRLRMTKEEILSSSCQHECVCVGSKASQQALSRICFL